MFIKIKVHPKSKKQRIREVSTPADRKLDVFVKSNTQNNMANKEALELVAAFFKISEKNVRMISGHHRQNKMLEINK